MIKSVFLKNILIIALIGLFGATFGFVGDDLKTFSSFTATTGVITGLISLGLVSYIESRLFPGGRFRGIPNNWDKIYMAREVGHATRDVSIFSLGLAITTRLIAYGLSKQLFSESQLFGAFSGFFGMGSLFLAKKWYDYKNDPLLVKLKEREKPSAIARSPEYTQKLKNQIETGESEEKKSLFKWMFISSSLAATIFAVNALKTK